MPPPPLKGSPCNSVKEFGGSRASPEWRTGIRDFNSSARNSLRCQTIRVTNLIKGLKANEVESVFSSEAGPVKCKC